MPNVSPLKTCNDSVKVPYVERKLLASTNLFGWYPKNQDRKYLDYKCNNLTPSLNPRQHLVF